MDDDFKCLLPASEVVHVSAVQWLESKKHMPEVEALMKQMRQWESLARQKKTPTKTEAHKIAKEHAIPLGRSIKDLGFLKLLPHIREFWLKRIGDLRSSKSMVPLFSPSKVVATERSRSSRGVAKASAEGTTGQASGSAEGHGVSTSSGLAPTERSRSPRGPSSVSAAITIRGASMSASDHGASSSVSEHGLHRFFKRKRDDVEHDDPAEPELGPSSSSRVGIVDETGNSMEENSFSDLFQAPTECESNLLKWLYSNNNDRDPEILGIRTRVEDWNSFAGGNHPNVRKAGRDLMRKHGLSDVPRKIQNASDVETWVNFGRKCVVQQITSRRVMLSVQVAPESTRETVDLEEVIDILSAAKFVRQSDNASDDLRIWIRDAASNIRAVHIKSGLAKNCRVPHQVSRTCGVEEKKTSSHRVRSRRHPLGWEIYEIKRRLLLRVVMELGPDACNEGYYPHRSSLSAVLQSTPQNVFALAAALRDPSSCLVCPFGADFEITEGLDKAPLSLNLNDRWHGVAHGGVHARWLALIELQYDEFVYDNPNRLQLPMVYPLLRKAICECRERRRASEQRTLIQSPEDLVELLLKVSGKDRDHQTDIRKKWLVDFCSHRSYKSKHLYVMTDSNDKDGEAKSSGSKEKKDRTTDEWWFMLSRNAVERIAVNFFDFVNEFNLHACLQSLDALQLAVIAIFHARLLVKPPIKARITSDSSFAFPLPLYVPASQVWSPSVPHFVVASQLKSNDPKQARITAPRVCSICGVGYLDWPSLFKHYESAHHSFAEGRKRLLFFAENLDALPLRHERKRTMLSNFSFRQTCSVPGRGCLGQGKAAMRQRVGCPVCAVEDWIDHFFPCYMWKPWPYAFDSEDEGNEIDEDGDDDKGSGNAKGKLLRDDQGILYFGTAEKVNAILNVQAYCQAWPLIPQAELYASSVRHPSHLEFCWLLNTRRVPTTPENVDDSASEHVSAGIGDADSMVWICGICAQKLCIKHPVMPPYALANWLWLGREHPAFQNLSLATRQLLGLARAVLRLLVLVSAKQK